MNEIMNKLTRKVTDFAKLKYIKIIMNSFMRIAAFSIGASIFSLIRSIPIEPWQNFLTSTGLVDILNVPIAMASNLYAVMVVLAIGYEIAKSFDKDPLPPAMVAFGSFMILTPFEATVSIMNEVGEEVVGLASNVLPISSLGSQGIFLAIITGILASRIYILLIEKDIKIKMTESVPPAVAGMFETMVPAGIVFILFLILRVIFAQTEFGTMQGFIYGVVQRPLIGIGGTPIGAALYLVAANLLWTFGIHGGLIAYATLGPIRQATGQANLAAFAANEAIPHLEWGLLTAVGNIGIVALTLLLLFSKSEHFKSLSKIALPTSIFNISEPIMFGLPIIFNPIMFVPYVLSPGISLLLTAFVMNIGLVAPLTGVALASVIPAPIHLWMATNSISGLLWGFALIAINMVIFFPFFKVAERANIREEELENIEKEELSNKNSNVGKGSV